MKNTRGLKFLSGVVVVLFLGFIMGGCQKEAIDSDMEGHWELLEFTTAARCMCASGFITASVYGWWK